MSTFKEQHGTSYNELAGIYRRVTMCNDREEGPRHFNTDAQEQYRGGYDHATLGATQVLQRAEQRDPVMDRIRERARERAKYQREIQKHLRLIDDSGSLEEMKSLFKLTKQLAIAALARSGEENEKVPY